MIHDNSFSNMGGDNAGQCLLSYELLLLLEWLIEHDKDRLQKLVEAALRSGLKQKLAKKYGFDQNQEMKEQAHYTIIEFFGLFEIALSKALDKNSSKTASEKKLLSTLDHIDSTVCDIETLRGSIEKTATKLEEHPCENPQQLLFEEILKSWKPGKKQVAH